MNKQIFYALLYGVLVFSAGVFISCENDDVDELKSRVTVVEGMIREVKQQLESLPAGSTVTSATQNEGIWTLVLSSGQTITINPSAGGAALDVLEKENSIVITVDGKEYELPFGAGFYSLIYAPEFKDGEVRTGANGRATAKFLVKPALTATALENATFTIGAANELKIRSARSIFNVDGAVTVNGEYIDVPIRVLDGEASGKTYALALQMNLSSGTYLSNYFNLVVSPDFTGTPEDVVAAKLISAVTDYTELENGFSTATLPVPTVDPLGTFNFKDLFAELPAGTVRFELGGKSLQNDNVARDDRYAVFRSALSADGTWELKGRPGTNGDAPNTEQNSGILINVIVDDVIKHKIYWKIIDPIASIPDAAFAGSFSGSPHIEYPETVVWEKGARIYNFNQEFTKGDFKPMHDGGTFVQTFANYEVLLGSDYIIYNDGSELQLGELGAKLAKHSRGLYWGNRQSSIAASQRRNLDIPADQKGNGEIIAGYDGIPASEMWDTFGFRVTNTGLEMSDKYGGNALRVGVGLRYEYAYGERFVGHNGALVFFWINRRVSPADVIDPAPR